AFRPLVVLLRTHAEGPRSAPTDATRDATQDGTRGATQDGTQDGTQGATRVRRSKIRQPVGTKGVPLAGELRSAPGGQQIRAASCGLLIPVTPSRRTA